MHASPLPLTSLRFPIIIVDAGAHVISFWREARYNHHRGLLLYREILVTMAAEAAVVQSHRPTLYSKPCIIFTLICIKKDTILLCR